MAIKLEFACDKAKQLYNRTPNRTLFRRKKLFTLKRNKSYLIKVSNVLGNRLLAIDKSRPNLAFQIN